MSIWKVSSRMLRRLAALALVVVASGVAAAQDFAKVLMEERVTLEGREATVTLTHFYYKAIKHVSLSGNEKEFPASFIQIDISWDGGDSYPVWRQPANIPLEVEVEHRAAPPGEAGVDVEAWPRPDGDRLVFVYSRFVYSIDPWARQAPIPDPPVVHHVRQVPPEGVKVARDVYVNTPAFKWPLVNLSDVPQSERKRIWTESWKAVEAAGLGLREMSAVRVLTSGATITVLSGSIAAVYNGDTQEITHRPITVAEARLIADAPFRAQPAPKRAWDEYMRHDHLPPPEER